VNLDGYALPVKKIKGTDPVETLDLSRKSLGVASAVVIASLIGVNGGLTALDLSFNNLNDEGVSAVCEAIQSNKETKLASLNMGANSISPIGAKSVASMVAVTGTLMECDVSNNGMGKEGKASILSAAQGKAGFNLHL
jgi:Ran GTPase-activating protein (RanGAP) involved in mRNA processing and transport